MKKEILEEIEIMGHKIKISTIENPHIRKALQTRMNSFLFRTNYTESEHTETYKGNPSHKDFKGGHTDETTYDNYSERSTHTDYTRTGKSSHTDITRGHDDYTEWKDSHMDWDAAY